VSDYLGRGVILAALTVSACACGLFLAVHGIVLLFAARVLQGVAVSAASGALRAALIKLQPGRGGLEPQVTCAVPTLDRGGRTGVPACLSRPAVVLEAGHRSRANDRRLAARPRTEGVLRGLGRLCRFGRGQLGEVRVDQGAAYIGDVDNADQAGVADDRQVPEMAARHDVGRITDARLSADDGQAGVIRS
jgi:hypothetical protein